MGRGFTEFSFVVASPRSDCVTAALVGYSREKSGAAIKAGLVTQNYQVAMSTSQKVDVGDKISIRGKGKFVLDRIGPMTKKGRHPAYLVENTNNLGGLIGCLPLTISLMLVSINQILAVIKPKMWTFLLMR